MTNGSVSIAIFNYLNNGMNWTRSWYGGNDRTSLKSNEYVDQYNFYAVAGYDLGDGHHFLNINGSHTENISDIDQMSNVGIPGKFIFDLSEISMLIYKLNVFIIMQLYIYIYTVGSIYGSIIYMYDKFVNVHPSQFSYHYLYN